MTGGAKRNGAATWKAASILQPTILANPLCVFREEIFGRWLP